MRCYAIHNFLLQDSEARMLVPKIRSNVIKINSRRWVYAVETVDTYNNGDRSVMDEMDKLMISSTFQEFNLKLRDFLIKEGPKTIPYFKKLFKNELCFNNYIVDLFDDDHRDNFGLRKGKLLWIDFSIEF